jgi:hypothetical protein
MPLYHIGTILSRKPPANAAGLEDADKVEDNDKIRRYDAQN